MKLILSLQLFLKLLNQSLITLIRIILMSHWSKSGKKHEIKTTKCIILSNGPSLNSSIATAQQFITSTDVFCVNFFATTQYYEKIKPTYYIIAAPELFINDPQLVVYKAAQELFEALYTRTQWPLYLYVPFCAKKNSSWQSLIKQNQHIKIVFFNNTPIEGWRWFRHWLFRNNLGMPRPHNVLIPSLIIALNIGYKELYLFGVEHSWLKEISVDENNRVLINQKHFYDENTSKPMPMHKGGRGERNLAEILIKYVHTFEAYFIIKKYANALNAKIFNCTEGSFIDAFERKKIN